MKSAYLWGAASGLALAVFAPVLRPTAKAVVKGGINVGRRAKKVGFSLKEEFEDIVAEAQADLDRENGAGNPMAFDRCGRRSDGDHQQSHRGRPAQRSGVSEASRGAG